MSKIYSVAPDEIYALIGRVTVAWNDVQFEIYNIFTDLTKLSNEMSDAVFFSIRTDNAQRSMTLAAAKVALVDNEPLYSRLKKLLNDLGNMARARNIAIHTMWATHSPSNKMTPNPFVTNHKGLQKDSFDKQFLELEEQLKDAFREALSLHVQIGKHLASPDTISATRGNSHE